MGKPYITAKINAMPSFKKKILVVGKLLTSCLMVKNTMRLISKKTIRTYFEVTKPRIALLMAFMGFSSGFIAIKKGLGVIEP